jgi:hypothetical protein
MTTSPRVQIIEQVFALLICDTVLEDANRVAAIQLPAVAKYHKGLGPMSDPSSLDLIRGEVPSNEMVKVRNTSVRLRVE